MSQGGWEFRGNLDSYLSPEWPFGEEDVSSVSLSGDPAVIEKFSADMESYVLAYVRSTANLSAEDEQTISSVIAAHRDINVAYCRRLLSWIVSSRGTNSSLQAIVDVYLQFAPGPWREATLVAYLPLSHKARGVTAGGGGTVAARDGSGATEVDDASDEILSISGSTVMTDLSPLTAGSATKAKMKKLVALCNKYKSECAMLKDRLLEMRANDIEMLQDKLRGAQLDLQTVKRRNVDLKGRVQLLESQLHDALAEAGAGAGAGAGDSRRRAAGGATGRERGGAIVYSDASSTATARAEPSTDATAAVAAAGAEIAALRKQVRLLETRLQAVGSSSSSSSTGGQAAAGEVSAMKAAAGLPKADKRVRIAETAPAIIASSGTNASAIAAAAAAAVAASPPLPPPPPSFASTLHTLAVPLPLHAALASALDAWVDHEVAVAKSVDLGVIRGLLAELREMKPDGQGQEDGQEQEQEEGRLGEDGDGAAATNSNSVYRTGSIAATGKIKGVGGGGAIAKNKLSGPSASAPTRPTTQKTQQRSGAPVPPWPELRAFSLGVFIVILSQSLLLTGRKLTVADLSAGAANVYAWIVWLLDAGWPVCCQWTRAAVGAGRGLWDWLSELASLLIAVSAGAKG